MASFSLTAFAVVGVVNVTIPIVKHIRHVLMWRRAVTQAIVDDVSMMSSPQVLEASSEVARPFISTIKERRGFTPAQLVSQEVLDKREAHRVFCATWARIAKGKFNFARQCEDTPLNRAALHRFFLGKWTGPEPLLAPHHVDIFMTDVIDLTFEWTPEFAASMTKRQHRRKARSLMYAEKKIRSGVH